MAPPSALITLVDTLSCLVQGLFATLAAMVTQVPNILKVRSSDDLRVHHDPNANDDLNQQKPLLFRNVWTFMQAKHMAISTVLILVMGVSLSIGIRFGGKRWAAVYTSWPNAFLYGFAFSLFPFPCTA